MDVPIYFYVVKLCFGHLTSQYRLCKYLTSIGEK